MRSPSAVLVSLLVLAGCGASGPTREEAELRARDVASSALADGTVATRLDRLTTPDADGAMGNAGGAAPGIARPDVDYEHPRTAKRGDSWVVAYDLRRAPLGLQLCVEVTGERSRVSVSRDC